MILPNVVNDHRLFSISSTTPRTMSEKILWRDFPVVENILGCFHSFFRLLSTNKQVASFSFPARVEETRATNALCRPFCLRNECLSTTRIIFRGKREKEKGLSLSALKSPRKVYVRDIHLVLNAISCDSFSGFYKFFSKERNIHYR